MPDNEKRRESVLDQKNDFKSCQFVFSSGEKCKEKVFENSSLCYWHNPDIKKEGTDIKPQLEQKAKNGESMEGYQLAKTDLEDIYLIGADLRNTNLKRANLSKGHLYNINFKGANLFKVDMNEANLRGANLENADLLGVNFGNALLERINWGINNMIKNELEAEKEKTRGDKNTVQEMYLEAEEIYRNIKTNFKNRGMSTESGKFFYREMIMKRKQMSLFSMERFWSKLMDIICGYGEYPFKIITFSLSFIGFNALIYSFLGWNSAEGVWRLSLNHSLYENLRVLFNSFYYSVVTYTTLGYGDFTPFGFAKLFAFVEAYSGAFLMALFVITVYKHMMER